MKNDVEHFYISQVLISHGMIMVKFITTNIAAIDLNVYCPDEFVLCRLQKNTSRNRVSI